MYLCSSMQNYFLQDDNVTNIPKRRIQMKSDDNFLQHEVFFKYMPFKFQ